MAKVQAARVRVCLPSPSNGARDPRERHCLYPPVCTVGSNNNRLLRFFKTYFCHQSDRHWPDLDDTSAFESWTPGPHVGPIPGPWRSRKIKKNKNPSWTNIKHLLNTWSQLYKPEGRGPRECARGTQGTTGPGCRREARGPPLAARGCRRRRPRGYLRGRLAVGGPPSTVAARVRGAAFWPNLPVKS